MHVLRPSRSTLRGIAGEPPCALSADLYECYPSRDGESMLDLKAIHDKSIHHKQAVLESPLCGCFYCLRIYAPSEIKEWVARDDERTAICPHCGIDSVLPSIAVDLRPELLKAMQSRWFGRFTS